MTYLLSLKAGKARGRHEIELRFEDPSGAAKPILSRDVYFEREDRGVNTIARGTYEFSIEGLYWMHAYIDGQEITRSPFRVRYSRVPKS